MASDTDVSASFFVLQAGPTWTRYDADVSKVEPSNRGPPPMCSSCGGPTGMLTWLSPYRADLELHGDALGDFVKTTSYELVVSEQFAQAFREEGLTGLNGFHALHVRRTRNMRRKPIPADVPRYFVVEPCHGRAALDLTRSLIHFAKIPTCDDCRHGAIDAVHSLVLEESTWLGEDIFRPRGLQGTLVVSERFKRFVERHRFTNMRLTPIAEYVWNPLARDPALAIQDVKAGRNPFSQ